MTDITTSAGVILDILPAPVPPVVEITEQTIATVEITTAPRGPRGDEGPPGDFDQEELEAAVEGYLSENPIDIEAPDFTAFFENGLS